MMFSALQVHLSLIIVALLCYCDGVVMEQAKVEVQQARQRIRGTSTGTNLELKTP
jgi:hypothetical protein